MLTVAYLANQFPAAVEPYVGEEIEELRRRGVRVIPGSVWKAAKNAGNTAQAVDTETIFLQRFRMLVVLRGAWLLLRRRKRIADLLHRVVREGNESMLRRGKALLHTGIGAYYAALLEKRNVDHVHVHHGYFSSWIGMVAARLLGVSFSMTLHGSDLLLHRAYLDTKLKHCRFCATISKYNRRHILDHYEIDPDVVIVSRLGVDVPERIAKEQGLRHRMTLLSVGRLHPVKDHALLIRACALLRDLEIDFECLIAGEGPERKRLESLIREYRLEQQVTLLGHISREQMDSLHARADVVVLTSRSEGIPLALMEAMARGKIVVAPAITGIPELVIPEKTGFLYEPGSEEDLVARIFWIQAQMRRAERTPTRLDWIRHAAHWQVRHNFNRRKNLENFVDRFLALATAKNWSATHEDSLLQQIQLPIQRNRGLPVRSDGLNTLNGPRSGIVFHGRPAGKTNSV
jgi:colanic acid/amylovoran biosynthesis glycosyltransferase